MADPFGAFRYRVEIDGLVEAGFNDCSGVQAETDVEEVQEGGLNDYVHRLPKGTKHVNLSLKRGLTVSTTLWSWHREVASGVIKRKNVHVVLLDLAGTERWRWTFKEAYPVKWTGPELRAESGALAFESVELAHNGIDAQIKTR
ncbi:MAG: phage tail protein [Chloroflexota bacterium]